MSSSKAALKAVNEAIRKQKWDEAIAQASSLLEKEPSSYLGHVFLAFALDKKDDLEGANDAYEKAASLRPDDPQAWQGLVKLYEKRGPRFLAKYQKAALRLAEIFRDAEDMYKCQDVVDKFIDYARAQEDRLLYVQALELILPGSPIYPALEGRVFHPAKSYETIAQILEIDEKKRINTLIGERRTRLGAKLSQVTLEVNREILCRSRRADIYNSIISWTPDDDVRRQYEEKLLQFRYDRLLVTPEPEKAAELKDVQKLASDMVIIKHPFKLAWDITVEWQDVKEIKDYDVNLLTSYCANFPDSDLYGVLAAYMTSKVSPFPKLDLESLKSHKSTPKDTDDQQEEDTSEDDDEGGAPTSIIPITDEDRFTMLVDGVTGTNSLLAHRLVGEYYQHLEEHESNVELIRKAMKIMMAETDKTGKVFCNTNLAFLIYLGTALVFYQSPRNHGEAKTLFEHVLSVDPASTAAMIGVGLIYEEEEEYDQAIDFLERALHGDTANFRVRAEVAWLYALTGDNARGKADLESILESMVGKTVSKELLAQTRHRLGRCVWNLDSSKAARKSRSGAYSHFVGAIKSDIGYAPAYTSLGIYYSDYAKDKNRARKCFLQAVELSSSELESAERLARLFADDGDWDRVELVAQRVVTSGKVKPPPGSKKKGISWPLSALGVAELNKQDYSKAIVSFQQALRIAPEDYHSWVGLGESYHSSGRFIAATKAIQNAQRLEEAAGAQLVGDTWFTNYLLANVKRDLGEYDEAIAIYRKVIAERSGEAGVSIALLQTMVENAQASVDRGFFGKAIQLATEAISFAQTVPEELITTFNFWKAVGDASAIFSYVQSRIPDLPINSLRQLIGLPGASESGYSIFFEDDAVDKDRLLSTDAAADEDAHDLHLKVCLHASILAHKRAIEASANDVHAQAVAYYNLGWAENRAHVCVPLGPKGRSSAYKKAAAKAFKRAIELESGNADFWNALGVTLSDISPVLAQHAFVRSLHINERSAHTWANLGGLALLQNDPKLANEAFTRAQSNDPDYAHAWLGQGLVALLYGDAKEARGLFTHAMDISNSSSLLTRRQYSVALFDHVLASPANSDIVSLIHPLFALAQIRALQPQDLAYQHLTTLLQERVDDAERATQILEKTSERLESDYEKTESPRSLGRFALSKTDLARSYLSARKFAEAVECGEMALQLSDDEAENELSTEERRKARLSAHLTVGLAKYFNGQADEAVAFIETALTESNNNPDAVCVLAQVLWATGSSEAREKARSVLFDVIGEDSSHVQSVLLLGVIALLDEDNESLEAVVPELKTLRTSAKATNAEHAEIGEVLRSVAALGAEEADQNSLLEIQADIMLYPHLPHGWSRLAEAREDEHAADMALAVAQRAIPPKGDLDASELSSAFAGTGKVADAQKSILMAPWLSDGWEALSTAAA